jgi:hypothetical protein
LVTAAEVDPEEILSELERGRLSVAITVLDPTSLVLAIETVQELIHRHETLDATLNESRLLLGGNRTQEVVGSTQRLLNSGENIREIDGLSRGL